MTIVGFERWKDGTCSLLVLDPGYKSSVGIEREFEQMNRGDINHTNVPRAEPAANPPSKSTYRPLDTNNGRIDGWVRPRPNSGSTSSSYSKTSSQTIAADSRHQTQRTSDSPTLKTKGELPSLRAGLFGAAGASGSPPSGRKQANAASKRSTNANRLLAAYRRDAGRLSRHREFEILVLEPQAGMQDTMREDSMCDDDFDISVGGS